MGPIYTYEFMNIDWIHMVIYTLTEQNDEDIRDHYTQCV